MKRTVTTTEREIIHIRDLKKTDHIGWLHNDNGEKGYISKISDGKFVAICADGAEGVMVDTYINSVHSTILEAVDAPANIKAIYVFDTRKELYQWLASDEN